MSGSNFCFLSCIQVSQETGEVVVFPCLYEFSKVFCDPHKDFSVVSEAEVDFFFFLHSLAFSRNVGNLISRSSAFSKSRLYIWKFLVHVLLKPSLKDFSMTLLACEMSSVVW